MAIWIYSGFVGSGKSYAATALGIHVAEHPLGKDWVLANFPITKKKRSRIGKMFSRNKSEYVDSRWIYKDNDEITVDYLIKLSFEMGFYGHEGSCLVILDEAGIMFNARDWNVSGDDRKKWVKFLTQSRKFGYDFILITQSATMIDKQIRVNAEFERVHKKLNSFSIFALLPWTIFAGVDYWNGIKNATGNAAYTRYKKKVADRYDTTALFGHVKDEVEALGVTIPHDMRTQSAGSERTSTTTSDEPPAVESEVAQ